MRVFGKETALQIFCALLARDPLPQQRYQDIGLRMKLLAHIACKAAQQFNETVDEFSDDPKLWDKHVASPAPPDARVEKFLESVRGTEKPLTKGEMDLIDQMFGEKH